MADEQLGDGLGVELGERSLVLAAADLLRDVVDAERDHRRGVDGQRPQHALRLELEQPAGERVVADQLDHRDERLDHPLLGVVDRRRALVLGGDQADRLAGDDGANELLLAREPPVDRDPRDARAPGDRLDARAADARELELLERGVEDPLGGQVERSRSPPFAC